MLTSLDALRTINDAVFSQKWPGYDTFLVKNMNAVFSRHL